MKNNALISLLLRLAVGASMFSHGLVRLPKLHTFSQWMVSEFQKSFLPEAMVGPFSYLLPFLELLIGMLLLLGLFTRQAALAGGLVMSILLFGSGLIEEWGAMPSQLLHCLFFLLILALLPHNRYSLDQALFPSSTEKN